MNTGITLHQNPTDAPQLMAERLEYLMSKHICTEDCEVVVRGKFNVPLLCVGLLPYLAVGIAVIAYVSVR